MPQPLSGPGVGLAANANLYPSILNTAPYDFSNNRVSLAPGDALPIPAGDWYIDLGALAICTLQYLDPITNSWQGFYSNGGTRFVKSDGYTVRVANMTNCPITGIITLGGTAYVQSSTTITASTGGSLWQPIVGGAATTSSVIYKGLGYGIAPLVFIPAPPAPISGVPQGIQATAVSTISGTTVTGITIVNSGAGYTGSTIAAIVLPNPADPSIGTTTISAAGCYLNIGFGGQLAAGIVLNSGSPAAPTMTVAGAGSNATIGAVNLLTLTTASVTNGGAGFVVAQTEISTVGGQPVGTETIPNPAYSLKNYRPRRASMLAGVVASGGVLSVASTIFDPGLFAGTGGAPIVATSGAPTSAATIGLTFGSLNDTISIQNAP